MPTGQSPSPSQYLGTVKHLELESHRIMEACMRSPRARGREMGSAAWHWVFQVFQFHLLSLWLHGTPDKPYKAATNEEQAPRGSTSSPKESSLTPALCRQARALCFPPHSAHHGFAEDLSGLPLPGGFLCLIKLPGGDELVRAGSEGDQRGNLDTLASGSTNKGLSCLLLIRCFL